MSGWNWIGNHLCNSPDINIHSISIPPYWSSFITSPPLLWRALLSGVGGKVLVHSTGWKNHRQMTGTNESLLIIVWLLYCNVRMISSTSWVDKSNRVVAMFPLRTKAEATSSNSFVLFFVRKKSALDCIKLFREATKSLIYLLFVELAVALLHCCLLEGFYGCWVFANALSNICGFVNQIKHSAGSLSSLETSHQLDCCFN